MTARGPIDCDLHPAAPDMKSLLPYLDEYWRETVVSRGIDGLDLSSYPPHVPAGARPDWRPAAGKPGADLDAMRTQALDPWGTRYGILHCLHGALALPNEDFAVALARAVNDWLAAEWLAKEPRLRASILVATQNPEMAVEEIERRAGDLRFVQVLMLVSGEMPLGKRPYLPIYRAAARHGMPVGIHAGSAYRQPTTTTGWGSYYAEDYVAQATAFQNQVLSLVYGGVFKEVPELKVVLIESGFTWLPSLLWRANKTWRGVRREVPWIDRPPSDIVREHMRLTLQPVDAPPDPDQLERVIDQIGSDEMLLFSTDYPHWHFEGDQALPRGLSDSLREKITVENPTATYPRLKESAL